MYFATFSLPLRHTLPALMLTAAVLAVPPAQAQAAPGYADAVLGRWNVSVTAPDGSEYPSWFDIRLRTESELMASMVGRFGSTRHAGAAELKDGRLRLAVPRQYERGAAELVFEGALSGDGQRLSGTTRDDSGATLAWTAQRAPALPKARAARWGRPATLFNGRDLQGWKPDYAAHAGCWRVEQGVLVNAPPCHNLVSALKLDDFKLHMEFKNVTGGNSGVYLRGRYEVQINDGYSQPADPLRMGAVYGHLRPTANASRPAGQWQTLDVTLSGRYVTVVLNGATVIDAQEIPGITGGALDSREAEPGPLMLQGDHSQVHIRKLIVTPALRAVTP